MFFSSAHFKQYRFALEFLADFERTNLAPNWITSLQFLQQISPKRFSILARALVVIVAGSQRLKCILHYWIYWGAPITA